MWDVRSDRGAEKDLDGYEYGDRDEGEEGGIEYSKALRTGYPRCLLRSPGFRFLRRF